MIHQRMAPQNSDAAAAAYGLTELTSICRAAVMPGIARTQQYVKEQLGQADEKAS